MIKIELFNLFGVIDIKDEASSKIDGVNEKGEGLGNKFKDVGGKIVKGGAAIVAGVIAAGTALFGMAVKGAEATDRIDKLSQKIGISRQGFQEWEYVLSQNGASIEVLQRGFKTLNDRMAESVEGTGKGAEAFDALGLSATDLNGELKTQEQMFDEAARALMNMPEGAEKSALAFDLFGKAGQELMPLLNGTEEGLDSLKQAANDMGLVLSDESVSAGAAFTDSMDNIKRSLGSIVTQVGVEAMPIMQKAMDWVVAHMPQIRKIMSTVFQAIGVAVRVASNIFNNVLLPVFSAVYGWVQANWPTIQKVIQTVMTIVGTAVKVGTTIISGAFNGLKAVIGVVTGIFNSVKNTISNTINSARDVVKNAIDKIKSFFNFSWSLPKLKLPSISISGSFSLKPLSVPKFGISWFAKGAMMDSSTIFGGAGNTLFGGGEAGKEGIVPLEGKHMYPLADAVSDRLGGQGVTNNFNIREMVIRTEDDIRKVARELKRLQDKDMRTVGVY